MAGNCIQSLRILVGLGFTTCLTDDVYTACYQPYLNCFLKYDRGNFQKHPSVSKLLANDIANMIRLAVKSFQGQHCPVCHKEFMNIIKGILEDVIVVEIGKRKEAKQILDNIIKK